MENETRAQRLRLLLVAGLAAPAVMVAVGITLGLIPGGGVPDLMQIPTWLDLAIGAIATAASMGLVYAMYRIHPSFERALRKSGMKVGLDALEVAGYPVMLVVVTAAALGEEVLFRGGLQPLIGVFPAAILFGFSHGGWKKEMWAYAVAASISGSAFGAVYAWTGNIWVPITAHALHNVLSTVLMGKKVDITWEGLWPLVRLVPDPVDDEEDEAKETELVTDDPVDEPVSPETDGEATGADDGDPADRPPV